MTNIIHRNELRKREFFEHLKGADGFAKDSVDSHAEAIALWQFFSKNEDFANFNKTKALAFREWLTTKETKTKAGKLALSTQYNYLRRINKFFKWLSQQPDYKNKIPKTEVDYLRLSKTDSRMATAGTTKKMPTFEEAKKIIESIEVKTEIDMRDRAMICFALITGARISAITSLKIKNFDEESKAIDQNPGDGVKTKNSKRILTTFFPIGWDEPEKYFLEWYKYLKTKGFQPDDPIFPSTLNQFNNDNNVYSKKLLSKDSWSGTSSPRKIFEKRCKNADLPYFHPHSFRHLIVNVLSKTRLTEEEKRAISLNLGHANVGTTFGSYGYGSMSNEDAIKIVQKLKNSLNDGSGKLNLSNEEMSVLEKIVKRG